MSLPLNIQYTKNRRNYCSFSMLLFLVALESCSNYCCMALIMWKLVQSVICDYAIWLRRRANALKKYSGFLLISRKFPHFGNDHNPFSPNIHGNFCQICTRVSIIRIFIRTFFSENDSLFEYFLTEYSNNNFLLNKP
jgi:hypothetical protein